MKKLLSIFFCLFFTAGVHLLSAQSKAEKTLFFRGGFANTLGWIGLEMRYGHVSIQSGYRYVNAASRTGLKLGRRPNWNYGVNFYLKKSQTSLYVTFAYGSNVFPRTAVAFIERDTSWASHYSFILGLRAKYSRRIGFKVGMGIWHSFRDEAWVKELHDYTSYGVSSELTIGIALF